MKNFISSQSPIIVFSHLRWEFVTQRPQHIMTRLAKNTPVLFVEEPVPTPDDSVDLPARIFKPAKNVTVVQPYVDGSYTEQVGKLVRQISRKQRWGKAKLWFYSPMFVEMIDQIPHTQVIYDCMDELSAFLGAPQELIMNERVLMSKADIVFTGGRSLYESKKQLHDNVFCFPSSVDRAHFEKAHSARTDVPGDIKHINKSCVGFYGVIDERLDLELLEQISNQSPEVDFVVIGPVVKIDQSKLPQKENIHYLGSKRYEELPGYLKWFDVAMMPFALNESTKFISPTKTLEFMAAKKPIISTPIKDVAEIYKDEVAIVKNSLEFTAALHVLLNETSKARSLREERQEKVVESTSWDKTVQTMENLMDESELQQKEQHYSSRPVLTLNYSL